MRRLPCPVDRVSIRLQCDARNHRAAIPNRQIVSSRLRVFEDFHLHSPSAPEWNQRYIQMSAGVMHSSLAEWSAADAHVFRKWMSGRVVQQGGMPRGQVCFALLGRDSAGGMRVQGQEFRDGDLLVLRGGEEFEFQRPAGVELLSVTFAAETFLNFLDQSPGRVAARGVIEHGVLRPAAGAFNALRLVLRAQLSSARISSRRALMEAVHAALLDATRVPAPRAASIAAARVVKSCQEIATSELYEQPVHVEDLCRRLNTSRRTLQGSFNRVTGTSPLIYLRNIRLNAVRRRLLSSPAGEVSVSQAAGESGFDHFGHFAGEYKTLFGELPSKTRRASLPQA